MTTSRLLSLIIALSLSGCATQVMRSSLNIEFGHTKEDVVETMGNPNDRQFNARNEAWTYCNTGFVNDSFLVIWFYDASVIGTTTYKDGVGDIGMCSSHIRSINWENRPDISVEIRKK